MSFPIRSTVLGLTAAACVGSIAPAAHAQNLVANAGFETGDLTGYTDARQFSVVGPGVDGTGFAAATVAFTGAPARLTQSLVTTPGRRYAVSFFALNALPGSTENFVRVLFGGTTLFDQVIANGTFLRFSMASDPVLGAMTDLTFEVANDPSATYLDNIGVTALDDPGVGTTTTPEPATLALVAGALAAWTLGARRRRARLTHA